MSHFPSAENATDKTKSVWPVKVLLHLDLERNSDKSQILSVLSREPEAKDFPSGEKATEYTES